MTADPSRVRIRGPLSVHAGASAKNYCGGATRLSEPHGMSRCLPLEPVARAGGPDRR